MTIKMDPFKSYERIFSWLIKWNDNDSRSVAILDGG